MVAEFLAKLEPAISSERLSPYRAAGTNELEVVVNYLYNQAITEALYSPLCCLEISLRNSLNDALKNHLGTPAWYDQPGLFRSEQIAAIQKAKNRATPRNSPAGVQPTPGKVIAELNFGFWTSLLSGDYEASLWRPNKARLLKETFKYVPKRLRQRNTIYGRYNRLRELRNRVFHHEPIWNRPTLAQDYRDIIEAIGWTSPSMAQALDLIDRFDDVFRHGKREIERNLRRQLRIL